MSRLLQTVSLAHSAADDTLSAAAKSSAGYRDFSGKFQGALKALIGVGMSHQSRHIYEFEPFRLDVAERLLLRDGKVVQLQPKVFDLLLVLVKHHGRLLEKDELMKAVWPDTVVEEANLANNISILRKTLGESGQRYIETVSKRGYRFIANVRELRISDTAMQDGWVITGKTNQDAQPAPAPPRSRRYLSFAVGGVAALSVIGGLLASYQIYYKGRHLAPKVPRIMKFTTTGNIVNSPGISPDGRFVAYVLREAGGAALWIKQTDAQCAV